MTNAYVRKNVQTDGKVFQLELKHRKLKILSFARNLSIIPFYGRDLLQESLKSQLISYTLPALTMLPEF